MHLSTTSSVFPKGHQCTKNRFSNERSWSGTDKTSTSYQLVVMIRKLQSVIGQDTCLGKVPEYLLLSVSKWCANKSQHQIAIAASFHEKCALKWVSRCQYHGEIITTQFRLPQAAGIWVTTMSIFFCTHQITSSEIFCASYCSVCSKLFESE